MAMARATCTSCPALGALVAALALSACVTKSEIRAKGRGAQAPAEPDAGEPEGGPPDAHAALGAEAEPDPAPPCVELTNACPENTVHRPFVAPAHATPLAVIPPPPGVRDRVLDQVITLGDGQTLWLFSGTRLEDAAALPRDVLDGYVSSARAGDDAPWRCDDAGPARTLSLAEELDGESGAPVPFLLPIAPENDFGVSLSVGGYGPRDAAGVRNLFLLRRYGDTGRDVYLASLQPDGGVQRGDEPLFDGGEPAFASAIYYGTSYTYGFACSPERGSTSCLIARAKRAIEEPMRSSWQFFVGGSGNDDSYQGDVTAAQPVFDTSADSLSVWFNNDLHGHLSLDAAVDGSAAVVLRGSSGNVSGPWEEEAVVQVDGGPYGIIGHVRQHTTLNAPGRCTRVVFSYWVATETPAAAGERPGRGETRLAFIDLE